MRKIWLSPLAESDLIDIWHYSLKEWGEAQADHYLDFLDEGIQRLASNPESGANRDRIRRSYRVLFVKSHAIYYKITLGAIHIIRVLHVRMDADGHL